MKPVGDEKVGRGSKDKAGTRLQDRIVPGMQYRVTESNRGTE
jgi:hypothetical protein